MGGRVKVALVVNIVVGIVTVIVVVVCVVVAVVAVVTRVLSGGNGGGAGNGGAISVSGNGDVKVVMAQQEDTRRENLYMVHGFSGSSSNGVYVAGKCSGGSSLKRGEETPG